MKLFEENKSRATYSFIWQGVANTDWNFVCASKGRVLSSWKKSKGLIELLQNYNFPVWTRMSSRDILAPDSSRYFEFSLTIQAVGSSWEERPKAGQGFKEYQVMKKFSETEIKVMNIWRMKISKKGKRNIDWHRSPLPPPPQAAFFSSKQKPPKTKKWNYASTTKNLMGL